MVDANKQTDDFFPTQYWHLLENGSVQCDLCPHFCQLKKGQQGLCFIRCNHNEQIVLTSYGRSSGFCIDPIEKKPLNHFLPGTPILSFGTAGCNLSCKFCQNWDMSKSREVDILADQATPEKIARIAYESGCRSVAYTYNDPVIFMEYAIDIAKACREYDIKSVAVTAAYINQQPAKKFFNYMDAANVDLKAFTEQFYRKLTGGHLQTVLDTLVYLKHETNVWLETTTLLIPGKNDSVEEIDKMTRWVVENLGADVPMHFTAFHPSWKMMDIPATPQATLSQARHIALENGVHYAYTGNTHDKSGESTYCHHCGQRLIARDWYVLSEWNLDENSCCKHCGTCCAGIFDKEPGDWGAKRQPVYLKTFS
ncbi:MAG: AmmeMemoRadiSam system radical SAM enzyme [gamma proteobacterium symbiont of Taylorina sp.]|nr:AmmeMemoRadiSam system radical SAM enzyme [gamma proteobacterium symbiont of Taylorina sp.]